MDIVLVACKSRVVRLAIQSLVEQLGYSTRAASTLRQAVVTARSLHPRLVLVDQSLCDGRGLERELSKAANESTLVLIKGVAPPQVQHTSFDVVVTGCLEVGWLQDALHRAYQLARGGHHDDGRPSPR